MGAIRKTLSVSTLGLVGWRSKKERLREAEQELDTVRRDLERTAKKEALLKERLLAAERRVEEAELHALSDARSARRRGARKAKKDHGVGLAGFLDHAVEDTKRRGKDVRAVAEARAAELQARSERARKKAAKRTEKTRKRLAKRSGEAKGRLAAVADEASSTVREKAARARELKAS